MFGFDFLRTPFPLLFLVGFLTACTTVSEADRAMVAEVSDPRSGLPIAGAEAANEPAQLVIYRTWNGEGLLFLASGPKVEVDGREVGRCLLGDGLTVRLPAGEHVISAPHSDVSTRRFRVSPGQTVYAECKYTMGVLAPNVQFEFGASR